MTKKVRISFNEEQRVKFWKKAKLKDVPTEDELAKALIFFYQKAITIFAKNVNDISDELEKLKGIRLNPQEDSYVMPISAEEFQLLRETLAHSIPSLKEEKDKKRVRRLLDDFLSDQEHGNRFLSVLLIVFCLKTELTVSINFDDAKRNLEEFIKENPFIKSSKNEHNNRARNIRRTVLRELKKRKSLTKEERKLLLPYVKERYKVHMRLSDEELFIQLLEDCQKKVDELSSNNV